MKIKWIGAANVYMQFDSVLAEYAIIQFGRLIVSRQEIHSKRGYIDHISMSVILIFSWIADKCNTNKNKITRSHMQCHPNVFAGYNVNCNLWFLFPGNSNVLHQHHTSRWLPASGVQPGHEGPGGSQENHHRVWAQGHWLGHFCK